MCMLKLVVVISLPDLELLLTDDALRFFEFLGDRPPRPADCPAPPAMVNRDISLGNPTSGGGSLGV